MNSLKKQVWLVVHPQRGQGLLNTVFDYGILSLIVLNVVALVLESTEEFAGQRHYFRAFERFCLFVFLAEYLARIWSCTASREYHGALWGRLRFALTPFALVDLLAFSPLFFPALGEEAMVLRMTRVVRALRLIKVARYYESLHLLAEGYRQAKGLLVTSGVMVVILWVILGTIVFECEHDAQPKVFRDIPSSLWWAAVTMTTLGYGDMFPITLPGRIITILSLGLGIGLAALPAVSYSTAVSALLNDLRMKRQERGAGPQSQVICPHCHKVIKSV